jgi:hypothetical protein
VLPGSTFEPPAPAAASQARRVALIAGAVVAVIAIALVTMFLARGPSHAKKPSVTPAESVATPPAVNPAAHKPAHTPAQQGNALAGQIASKLPVALASTALLRSGGDVYAVGGTGPDGKPVDGIWRIGLASGKVASAGTFVEPLAAAGVARRGGVLYFAGGWTGTKLATAVLRWVPGQSPTLVARLPVALRGASAGFAGSVLYVTKGNATYAVDVRTGSVTSAAHAPSKLAGAGSNLTYLAQSLLASRG